MQITGQARPVQLLKRGNFFQDFLKEHSMKPKIVVVGASGQLGSDCLRILSKQYQTIGITHKQLNISNSANVKKIMADVQPDVIINCAAFTKVDDCENLLEHAFKINAKGPLYLARSASELGAKLIHISTDYVFDGTREIPEGYVENDPPNPVSVYGKSKLAGEQAIISETEKYIIIRTAWLFGIDGNNFLKTIYKLAVSDSIPSLKVINTQYGSFTHTLDLARQIQRLIEIDGHGIYHASGEGYCSWYDGAVYFLKTMGIEKKITACSEKEFPTKAIRPANSILHNQRLIEKNMNIMLNWQVAIDQFVGLFKTSLISKEQNLC